MKFSIILLLYNPPLENVLLTLQSITKQAFDNYEIIIADDGSKVDLSREISHYFLKSGFSNFSFTAPKENVGTVRNILDGLEIARGKYVKAIGAGDLLFEEKTLERVYNFLEQNSYSGCFGLMQGYKIQGQTVEAVPFRAPQDIQPYLKQRQKQILRNILVFGDWVSGASMFFEKEYLLQYLNNIAGTVLYCEDLLVAEMAARGETVPLFDETLIWYEVGDGISTDLSNTGFRKKLQDDHDQLWKYMETKYMDHPLLKRGTKWRMNGRASLAGKFLRILIEPGYLFFRLSQFRQKAMSVHVKPGKGFLDAFDGTGIRGGNYAGD